MVNQNPRSAADVDAHIGSRLREAREAHDLSQSDLANMLGITFEQIRKYEQGVNRVSAGRLYKVANALELPITFFFEGIKLPTPSRRNRSAR